MPAGETTTTLLVAATAGELCGRPGLVCGIGPVEAAIATTAELARIRPTAVLHVGVAGGRGVAPGTVVVGAASVYCDLLAAIPVVSRLEPDPALLAAALARLPGSPSLPIGTSAAVGGPCAAELRGPAVEAMEGFAVLRAATVAGVPALEVRVISNEIGEADRSQWLIEDALVSLGRVLPALLVAVDELSGRGAVG
jgi:futalosine hydrolase